MVSSRFRLNRIDGLVYRDYGIDANPQIKPVAHHLDGVVLWASNKFTDTLFGSKRQQWVQVCILTAEMELAYFMLNSGTTGALFNWENYVDYMQGEGRELNSVVTRFGFENAEMYFDYVFQPYEAPIIIERSQQWLSENPKVSMVDEESLPLNTVIRLKAMYRKHNPQIARQQIGLFF